MPQFQQVLPPGFRVKGHGILWPELVVVGRRTRKLVLAVAVRVAVGILRVVFIAVHVVLGVATNVHIVIDIIAFATIVAAASSASAGVGFWRGVGGGVRRQVVAKGQPAEVLSAFIRVSGDLVSGQGRESGWFAVRSCGGCL